MEKDDTPLLIGVSILSEVHEYFRSSEHDDLEHIIKISIIIKGICSYLENMKVSEKETNRISENLKDYAKNLWIESCLDAADEDEEESDILDEADYLFEYIYKNHEYPN